MDDDRVRLATPSMAGGLDSLDGGDEVATPEKSTPPLIGVLLPWFELVEDERRQKA
jgi:hypothetical protein